MLINEKTLMAVMGCSAAVADLHCDPLNVAMERCGINTEWRVGHFLSQVGHETGGLKYMKEIWGPTPAQVRYEGRRDLGNTQPGDGKRFLGRGDLGLTGRHNYTQFGIWAGMGDMFLEHPEYLETPAWAAVSAGWFWQVYKGLNKHADRNDIRTITRLINGGYNGLDDRMRRHGIAVASLARDDVFQQAMADRATRKNEA